MTRDELFAAYPAASRDLALAACELILRLAPHAVEIVNVGHKTVTYGGGKNAMSQMCYVAAFQKHINIGFTQGTTMADPAGLLAGTGKALRHVKIRQADDLNHPALHDLIRESLGSDPGS